MEKETAAEQLNDEDLIVQIASLAREFAMIIVAKDRADDIAQDVVLQCLVKIRAGAWRADAAELPVFVQRVVRRRAVDLLRRSRARNERQAAYVREMHATHHTWMSPELTYEERELREFHEQALARMPEMCRRTYLMVREEEETYQGAALRLGLRPKTVCAHLVRARHRFRRELAARGISSPVGRPPRVRRKRGRSRSKSCLVARAGLENHSGPVSV
jgi:RNA polymerase sigma factor (sigma-70 family)